MNMFKYYTRAVIYPSLLIQFIVVIYSAAVNYNYESEWMTAVSVIFETILVSFFFSLIMCCLSLTIFLNQVEEMSRKLIWNLLTWFLLPYGFIAIILIHEIEFALRYESGFNNAFIYALILTVPYLISFGYTFMRFRKDVLNVCRNSAL